MSEKPEKNNETADEGSQMPEGFDKPTGPFAKREPSTEQEDTANVEDYASYAEQPEDSTSNEPPEGELHAQLQEAKDQVLRAMAEAENTRRRAQKDREEASKYAIANFARDMLSVADNLRRAIDSIPENREGVSEHFVNLQTGIEATERELLKVLERNGVKKLSPMDETFDPNFHEVMFEAPMPDKEPGTVIQVMEEGYLLHDRLLRPARVGVAKAADPDEGKGQSIDTQA